MFNLYFALLLSSFAFAAQKQPQEIQREDLAAVKSEIQKIEGSLSNAKQAEATLSNELGKLEKLLKLQALEIQLSSIELEKMEERLQEMESRYQSLNDTISEKKKILREYLSVLPSLEHKSPLVRLTQGNLGQLNQYRELVAQILTKDRTEILALRDHLNEVQKLRTDLSNEKERVLGHTEDLKEKQAILALNKDLKRELLKKTKSEQIEKLRVYEAAKSAESELENMLSRIGQESPPPIVASTSIINPKSDTLASLGFARRKGTLAAPLRGEIISTFGKRYDPASSLYTFHKGIEIKCPPASAVKSIFKGKIVFSGKLGTYGNLLIIDHGDQFYSLAGHLAEFSKKTGDSVEEGEVVGISARDSAPLYFEIRQRHIAINPTPWIKL